MLFNLAWGDAVIVAPESIENIKSNPVGTGAYTFVEGIMPPEYVNDWLAKK